MNLSAPLKPVSTETRVSYNNLCFGVWDFVLIQLDEWWAHPMEILEVDLQNKRIRVKVLVELAHWHETFGEVWWSSTEEWMDFDDIS